MEENDQALAFAPGGDQRRSVGQCCPHFIRQVRVGFGQHLTVDFYGIIGAKPGKWAGIGEGLH